MPSPANTSKPSFGGHEKFTFRHGWLKKGVDAVIKDPGVFAEDGALVELGVGKNMVRSIRFWGLATGALRDGRLSSKRDFLPTPLGERLLADGGWDPYMEDPATLWLLHWQLASNRSRCLIWHYTFSKFLESEFTKKQLNTYVSGQLARDGVTATPGAVERDIDVCLRSYAPALRRGKTELGEESLDCPLADLGLIRYVPEDGIYQFNTGPKATLPPAIFGYALLRFLSTTAYGARTVAADDCLYRPGSPGQAFKLDENSVAEYLEAIHTLTDGRVSFQETTGLRQVYLLDADPGSLMGLDMQLLEKHYAH